jgi:hypothetical protein
MDDPEELFACTLFLFGLLLSVDSLQAVFAFSAEAAVLGNK